jgi:hypothetical protein
MKTRTIDTDEAAASLPDGLAELDRRWKVVESGHATVAHEDVVRWLRTWGTPDFRPWSERGRISI